VSVDLAAVRERKRAMVAGARENYASRLTQDGLDLIEGEARFTGPKTIEIALRDGGNQVEAAGGGRVRLTVRTPDGEQQVEGSHLLSAIGRVPNTEALEPAAAGIQLRDKGFIEVDEYLETSVPGVYAMGDVKGGPAFTHLSYDDYRIMRANLLGPEKASTRDRVVPYTMFIDPQLGRVGLTERQAREQKRAVRVAKLPMSAVIRALETGETRGFMKAAANRVLH
jgi:pyruvate/2-oxoglutarate dehydrogenase complex dihydrolipoamide dehydrogenase (E3) component